MLSPLTTLLALATPTLAITLKSQTCSPSQESKLLTAIGSATACIDTILQIHSGTLPFPPASSLRSRYFGTITDEAFLNITETFSLVQSSWNDKTFVCAQPNNTLGKTCLAAPGMDANAHIVVLTNGQEIRIQADEIDICPSFLDESHDGYGDTPAMRIPVLIHEMTHAVAKPGTQDILMPGSNDKEIAYGEEAVQQLAFWSPELAARNADSYALYSQAVCAAVKGGGEVLAPAEDVDRSEPEEQLASKIEERVFETSAEQVRIKELEGS